MVNSYTPQQFFDQFANIINRQLFAMNPKFGLNIAKQLCKPIAKKLSSKNEETRKEKENKPKESKLIDIDIGPKPLLQIS